MIGFGITRNREVFTFRQLSPPELMRFVIYPHFPTVGEGVWLSSVRSVANSREVIHGSPVCILLAMSQIDEVLHFWFNRLPDEPQTGKQRQVWFSKNPAFDREVARRFRSHYEQAAAGELDDWQVTPAGALALVLLLDQVPRHLFRSQAQAFATDAKALAVAQAAIGQGFDQALPSVQRSFLYLPLEHSENLDHQNQCVVHFKALRNDPDLADFYTYAERHRDIIQQFGRFPHRNAILGRDSTPAEIAFLQQPGSSF